MKDGIFEEFDLATTYQKLVAPSAPRLVKARDFFKQPDLITPLQAKMTELLTQDSNLKK